MKKLSHILALLFFFSCRKDVTLKLPAYKQRVVIEASIETGSPAIVFLSYSVPYFSNFDFSAPQNAFIKGATVVVSDGVQSETLTEVAPGTGYIYLGNKITGQVGKRYTLSVTVDGNTYSTSTSILNPPKLDSVYFKQDHDSLGFIWQHFQEPAGLGDCYRWMAKRLGRDQFYAAPFNSVFDDKFVDGKAFDFGYNRGPQPNEIQSNREDPERGYYKRGDTVVVKFSRIGINEYNFWKTYYLNKTSNSNPFSAPTNIKSMFGDENSAFGAFVGYGISLDTLIIPKL